MTETRIRSLDALRGIAALMVVIFHWVLMFAVGWTTPLAERSLPWLLTWHIVAEATTAVLVFFTLSGFVLTLSLQGAPLTYGQFVLKRVLRLYPPFLFTIALATILFTIVQPKAIPEFTAIFNSNWNALPTPAVILGHLGLIGTPRFESLDPSIWSLKYEMRASLLLPMIALLVRRSLWFALGVSLLVAVGAIYMARTLPPLAADWLRTFHYLVFFFWGSAWHNIAHRWRCGFAAVPRPYARHCGPWIFCCFSLQAALSETFQLNSERSGLWRFSSRIPGLSG